MNSDSAWYFAQKYHVLTLFCFLFGVGYSESESELPLSELQCSHFIKLIWCQYQSCYNILAFDPQKNPEITYCQFY